MISEIKSALPNIRRRSSWRCRPGLVKYLICPKELAVASLRTLLKQLFNAIEISNIISLFITFHIICKLLF